jgi:hypothetical protein
MNNKTILPFTVKPKLTTTSEQRPPVNNDHNFRVPRVIVVDRFDCIYVISYTIIATQIKGSVYFNRLVKVISQCLSVKRCLQYYVFVIFFTFIIIFIIYYNFFLSEKFFMLLFMVLDYRHGFEALSVSRI